MKCRINDTKQAIRDYSVFDGLAVDDRAKFAALFMQPNFTLLEFEDGEERGYVIFEEHGGGFIFHLVNFTAMRTRDMTERFTCKHVFPYCRARGLSFVQAKAERDGMARKLSRLGFENVGGNLYRAEVAHVL